MRRKNIRPKPRLPGRLTSVTISLPCDEEEQSQNLHEAIHGLRAGMSAALS
jgi:hypothetical protein